MRDRLPRDRLRLILENLLRRRRKPCRRCVLSELCIESPAYRKGDGIRPAARTDLGVEVDEMTLDRGDCDAELGGDLFVRSA